MHFNSEEGVSLFFDAVDSLEEEYDYSKSTDWDDTPDEIYHLGDAMLNDFDSALSFKSLRAKYELLEYDDDAYREKLTNFIDDPYLSTILNENFEVIIGKKYYNFSVPGVTIVSSDLSNDVINSIRSQGIGYQTNAISLYDLDGNIIARPEDDRAIRLLAWFTQKTYDASGGANVSINMDASSSFITTTQGPNQYLYQCGNYIFRVDWGDGSFSATTSGSTWQATASHYYKSDVVGSGQCQTYNIKVTATKQGDCHTIWPDIFILDQQVLSYNALNIQICNISCFKGKHRTERNLEFDYGGKRYKIRGEVQQLTQATFVGWSQSKIWGRITFYKRKSNGRFKKAKPPVNMTAQILGTVYNTDCANATTFESSRTNGHRREFKVKYKPGFALTTSRNDYYPVLGNFKVVLGYSGGQEISQTLGNVKLWD